MKIVLIKYDVVKECPLCGSLSSKVKTKLSRPSYFFGDLEIPLPESGVFLLECSNCSLLFKSFIPNQEDFMRVMSLSAKKVWHPKKGVHPAVELIKPFFTSETNRVIDIGAANGELLAQLQSYSSCVSALDIVSFPTCVRIVNGEYIIGNIENKITWSGEGYDIVTAFDIFEHFFNPKNAMENISSLLLKNGKLIIETGDWTFFDGNHRSWYYTNLFEHQIFWNQRSIEYLSEKFGFIKLEYNSVQHKNMRNITLRKKILLNLIVKLTLIPWYSKAMLSLGKGDPSRFVPPNLNDHAFIVLKKK